MTHPIKGFTHWVIWNIPATSVISEDIPHGRSVSSLNGAKQGIGYGLHKYVGPKPPKGKTHKYRISIYAIDCLLNLSSFSTKKSVLKAASNHIVQRGTLEVFFE